MPPVCRLPGALPSRARNSRDGILGARYTGPACPRLVDVYTEVVPPAPDLTSSTL